MKKFIVLMTFILAFFVLSCNKSEQKVDKFKVDPLPVIEDAMKNKKFLILIFESESCRFCTKLHKTVLDTLDFKQKLIKNNTSIAIINVYGKRDVIDPETRQYTNEQILAYLYRVQVFPTIVIFDPEKNYRKYETFVGYIDKDTFSKLLVFLNSGCYKKTTFTNWFKNGESC